MIIKGLYEAGQEDELKSPVLDNATAALEGTAIKFSNDAISDAKSELVTHRISKESRQK